MALYGYARVSTTDQDLSVQERALHAAGCQTIRAEKRSATKRDGRTELQILLDFLRDGDTLVVTRIDRLARSMKDLQDIVYELKAKGVALKATEQPIDTGTAAGKAFLDMLGVFAGRRDFQHQSLLPSAALGDLLAGEHCIGIGNARPHICPGEIAVGSEEFTDGSGLCASS
jgi:hypothetical protein